MNSSEVENKQIYFAPLQGYTNADYRNLHYKYFGGVDKYYSPYLRFELNKELKKSVWRDIQSENNTVPNFVPQVLGTDIPLFIKLANQFSDFGYKEINWNLGCPFPMVTNRGFGSALIKNLDQVKEILDEVLNKIEIPLSIKTRLGFENTDEISSLIELLNNYPIKELTIHARTAKQMYKGKASPEYFTPLIKKSQNILIYNGDINSVNDIKKCNVMFDNNIETFMLGRGMLKNPFLASEIKGESFSKEEKVKIIRAFHSELFLLNKDKLEPSHLLGRMQTIWEYLSYSLENQHKSFKLIKKAKRIDKYLSVVDDLLTV